MVSSPLSQPPRPPSRSSPPDIFDLPIPPSPDSADRGRSHPPRQSPLGFIRRMRSVERVTTRRSSSGGKLTKKQLAMERDYQTREATAISQQPPRIPDLPYPGRLQTFGGEDEKPPTTKDQAASPGRQEQYVPNRATPVFPFGPDHSHNVPVPSIPQSPPAGQRESVDPNAKTESMTHRGRYSYANSTNTVNSPRRMRRRKDPTPFNILIVGARNSGKTSFLNFLKSSLPLPDRNRQSPVRNGHPETAKASVSKPSPPNFKSQYLEAEVDGERIGVTLWDSQGLEPNVADLQLREISAFVESKFEDTFTEEMKVVRATGVQDTHIHCVFLILDPVRLDANLDLAQKASVLNGAYSHGRLRGPVPDILDENLDLQVLRTLQGKTTVVPIISKADTITVAHMASLKRAVWASLKKANLDPLEALGLEDVLDDRDDETVLEDVDPHTKHLDDTPDPDTDGSTDRNRNAKPTPVLSPGEIPAFPLSIISPDPATPSIVGRQFAWGFADPHNVEHCDFVRLKDAVFKEWRGELREASRDLYYEGWRTERLDGGMGKRGLMSTSPGNGVNREDIGRAVPYRSLIY
ncbi:MAG: hypothetical protein FRX48_07994 [Lasallia pustulata]|uniref:Septin-type G domain-containing protein n=1 Tax=Lasallia pustulata TaxID=136370 RepID=A0A5M8PI01_9LECA|nr:MAG: hypothetical protein FRX48_07994 [Lasallia pustulata]